MSYLKFCIFELLGYILCELAFRTDCWGPFSYAYRACCQAYEKSSTYGLACGALVPNPDFGKDKDEPMLIAVRGPLRRRRNR